MIPEKIVPPVNGAAVHLATRKCRGLKRIRHDGRWYYVIPAGTVLPCDVTVPVLLRTPRQQAIQSLFGTEDGERPFLWTMRDLCYALRRKRNRRLEGDLGKDLKRLGLFHAKV